MNPVIENPKSAIDGFELPCGYIDNEGKLHTSVEVAEMTGEEEEILAAKNMPIMKKMNKILSSCTRALGDYRDPHMIEKIIPQLTQGDRVFLLFAIRRVSLGNEFPFSTECPECKSENRLTVDLADLDIKHMPDPMLRVYEMDLPRSKKKAVMKVLTGIGEEAISKAAAVGKDVISIAILARLESLDGRPATVKDLKALSLMDRNALRDVWQDKEGGVDTGVPVQCMQCDHEYETEVDIGSSGFFTPGLVLKTWKIKSAS